MTKDRRQYAVLSLAMALLMVSFIQAGCAGKPPAPPSPPEPPLREVTLETEAVTLQIGFYPYAFLQHTLHCLSDHVLCGRDGFALEWMEPWSPSDQAHLDRWHGLVARHRKHLNSIRVASVRSETLKDSCAGFRQGREECADVLTWFWPRFVAWREEHSDSIEQALRRVQELAQETSMLRDLNAWATDHKLPKNAPVLRVALLPRPFAADSGSHGEQFRDVAFVEWLEDESIDARMDVIAHEYCHFLVGQMPRRQRRQLLRRLDSHSSEARALFAEVHATALGTMRGALWVGDSPEANYDSDVINAVAAAFFRRLDAEPSAGPLWPRLIDLYLAAFDEAYHLPPSDSAPDFRPGRGSF